MERYEHMSLRVLLLSILLLVAMSVSALACPYCESEVGKRVKAGIFNEDFGCNALLTLAPIPLLLLLVAWIHGSLPWPFGKREQE